MIFERQITKTNLMKRQETKKHVCP